MTLFSHALSHVVQPLFQLVYPATRAAAGPPPPSPTSSASSRFTELPPDDSTGTSASRPSVEATLLLASSLDRILLLAVVRPITDVGKLVRDGGVLRSVLRMAVAVGWEERQGEAASLEGEVEVQAAARSLRDRTIQVLDS